MTLAERRTLHDFETNQFPALKSAVEEAAGFAVPLEVLWDTLAVAGESRLYADCWPRVYFEPLIGALKRVGSTEIGAEAIKTGIKKIVVQNVKGCYYGDCWAVLEDGVLTLDHQSVVNASEVIDRENGLVDVLDTGL